MTHGLQPGAAVPIVVRKYDGRERFVVTTRVLRATPDLLIVRGEPGRPFVTAAETRRLPTTTLEYFPAGRWYNVVSFFDSASGVLDCHFCNVIAPITWDGGVMRYIDLDLDLRVTPGSHELRATVEDLADFRRNARAWRYPAAVRRNALAALRELLALAASGQPPFTNDPLPTAATRALAGQTVWEHK